jgi:hypothetical protein
MNHSNLFGLAGALAVMAGGLRHELAAAPTPFSPPSGPATGSGNGLHRESNIPEAIQIRP